MKIYKKDDLKNKDFIKDFYSEIEFEALNNVSEIIENVKLNKDSALIYYAKTFNDGDFCSADDFLVSEDEIEEAYKKTDKNIIDAINKTRIKDKWQMEEALRAHLLRGCFSYRSLL